MKNLYNSNIQDILIEFDTIKGININLNKPQFVVLGIKNKRIKQVLCDYLDLEKTNEIFNILKEKYIK